ncbi:MAG: adenosylcobinamide amidohydrolase [Vicinamibacterales bacterium]
MNWEQLIHQAHFGLRRAGRYLVVDLATPHRVLSTSPRNGGQVDGVRHLVNHQSCEGGGHVDRGRMLADVGPAAYHDRVCHELGLNSAQTATMGTAANMNYVALATERDADVSVTAAVTAGVEGNATAAGEPATWRETADGMQKVPWYSGTINTILLISTPLTPAALARVVVTMTEGKSAALQHLAVPSRLHVDLATGTGTDQFCVAAPIEGPFVLTSASPHLKLGELVGLAARTATIEALRWQNGLEVSYTRSVFHALGRYGVKEASLIDDIRPYLGADDLELLQKNMKSVCYEPLVGVAAHALAGVCDRVRYGMVPAPVA